MSFADLPSEIQEAIHFKSSEQMDELQDGSVQSMICSPPYWNLKDYGHDDQIGFGESYERYHERMDRIWEETLRVLKPSGTAWIVIDKVWRKRKVLNIPYHIARHCMDLGFLLQDMIVWNKPTAIAGMNRRNLVNKFEYVVFLSKGPDFKLNVPTHEDEMPPDSTRSGDLTDIWRFPVKAGSIRESPDHKAPYPDELISRLVEISTDPGDVILDPYLGSGTTMKLALSMGRPCVGYELNPDFKDVIGKRLSRVQVKLNSFH